MRRVALYFAVVCLWSCGEAADTSNWTESAANNPLDITETSEQGIERWSVYDTPKLLDANLEYNLNALPISGSVAETPWTGSYWPAYIDSINYRWGGARTEPATRKYQRAFAGNNVENMVSRYHGVDATVGGGRCTSNYQCRGASKCGRRAGYASGHCIPIWYGLCHAWAAASVLHPEPRHPVQHNNVTFNVNDIKALMTIVYHTATTKQVSLRSAQPPGALPSDSVGRPVDSSTRDTNPGTYHVLLANYLGKRRKTLIEDRDPSADVWNQPIRSFQVVEMHEINAVTAMRSLGAGNNTYMYNLRAERFMYVRNKVKYIKETLPETDGYLGSRIDKYTWEDDYEYILELDRVGNIIGGEWKGASKKNHPDFIWLPVGPNAAAVAGGAIRFDNVMQIVNKAY